MKKMKYIFMGLMFMMFVPSVYAFTYEFDMNVDNSLVKEGTNKEIKVSLKNIQGTSDGIIVCSLNISSSENITIRDSVKSLNSWSLTVGDRYLFDTGNPVLNDSEMFIIPVKINGEGYVEISDIVCSDAVEEIEISGKKLNFSIKEEENITDKGDDYNDGEEPTVEMSSNCNISNIELSEGKIEFDPNITEYRIDVRDFNTLEIRPTLDSDTASYTIDRNIVGQEKNVVITVIAEDGSSKTYTIYVDEINDSLNIDNNEKENNYTIIFIIIICILVLINIYRIIKNRKK